MTGYSASSSIVASTPWAAAIPATVSRIAALSRSELVSEKLRTVASNPASEGMMLRRVPP